MLFLASRCLGLLAGHKRQVFWTLALMLTLAVSTLPVAGQGKGPSPQSASSTAPAFGEKDALDILDNLQTTLQSYDRKKFLTAFDPCRVADFCAFGNQVKALFDRYDSFTVTYRLMQAAMEGNQGVVLADFGLDATSDSSDVPDLRRHAQLRLVLAWNGKEWKIVDLSPRAVFSSQ